MNLEFFNEVDEKISSLKKQFSDGLIYLSDFEKQVSAMKESWKTLGKMAREFTEEVSSSAPPKQHIVAVPIRKSLNFRKTQPSIKWKEELPAILRDGIKKYFEIVDAITKKYPDLDNREDRTRLYNNLTVMVAFYMKEEPGWIERINVKGITYLSLKKPQ